MAISLPILHRKIFRWYTQRGRKLPWRGIRNPYRVLVSEIMLQQTQVSRVLVKYPEFIRRFPDFRSLASARTSDVVRAWSGMGYNNRAVRLHQLARIVEAKYRGRLPATINDLLELPGVGPYTAHAIACFALRGPIATVDTNIRRVLQRVFPEEAKRTEEWTLARRILPRRNAYDWNQALMDLGALVCTAASPSCGECPILALCPSAFRSRSVRSRKTSKEELVAGFPNRIYRGRIVELLRHTTRGDMRDKTVGVKVRPGFSSRQLPWLRALLTSLQTDGVIILRKRGNSLYASLAE